MHPRLRKAEGAGPPLPATPGSTPTHRDEVTFGIFAATLVSGHTLVLIEQVARSTDTALLAGGGDFGTDTLTEAIWVGAGRLTGGKATGVEAVGWALQSCGMEEEQGSCHASDFSSHELVLSFPSHGLPYYWRHSYCCHLDIVGSGSLRGTGSSGIERILRCMYKSGYSH